MKKFRKLEIQQMYTRPPQIMCFVVHCILSAMHFSGTFYAAVNVCILVEDLKTNVFVLFISFNSTSTYNEVNGRQRNWGREFRL